MSESNLPPSQVSKGNPVLIMTAALTTYQTFVGGLAALDVVSKSTVGILVLAGAAVGLGWGVYTRGVVTPWANVVAKSTESGGVIAGPAAQQDTGSPVVVTDAATGEVIAPPADSGRDEYGESDSGALLRIALIVLVILAIVFLAVRVF